MNTGPALVAFLARVTSWFNSRLDRVVMVMGNPSCRLDVVTLLQIDSACKKGNGQGIAARTQLVMANVFVKASRRECLKLRRAGGP